jgi:D-alanine-D-alanine ligase
MLIGFTYDLKDDYLAQGYSPEEAAEFDSSSAVDSVAGALEKMGHEVDRVGNAFALGARLLRGEQWDMVFNVCEGLYGAGRESLVPAMLDACRIPYVFSDPLAHALTLNKAACKRVLRDAGLPTAEFMLITDPARAGTLSAPYPLFVKAVAEGTGKGISAASKVHDRAQLVARASELIRQFRQPVIVEPFLPGREVTVGILGSGDDAFCLGVMEIGFTGRADSDCHSYYNKEHFESAAVYTPCVDAYAEKCSAIALAAHRALDIRDASRVDIRADASGEPLIMEINSLPGLAPRRSDLILLGEMAGWPHQRIMEAIMDSAVKRASRENGRRFPVEASAGSAQSIAVGYPANAKIRKKMRKPLEEIVRFV